MEASKFAIFGLELSNAPEDVRLLGPIHRAFQKQPRAKETLFQVASSVDAAAEIIEAFKNLTCGSAYNVAVINLNQFSAAQELSFLLSPGVLGDPRTIFLASLRGIQNEVYHVARKKVDREAEAIGQGARQGAPSCIDSYSSAARQETAANIAGILNLLLDEEDRRMKDRQTGIILPGSISQAHDRMRRTSSIYCGFRPKKGSSGIHERPGSHSDSSRRFPAAGNAKRSGGYRTV